MLLLPLLDAALDGDQAALGSGNCALNQQQVPFCVHPHHLKVLYGDVLAAHMSGQVLGLKHAGGAGAGAHGADSAMIVGTVGHAAAVLVEAFDHARESFALGFAGNVNLVAFGKHIGLENLAHFIGGRVVKLELPDVTEGFDARLGAMACSGLVAELLIFFGRFLVDVFALLTGLLAFCERFPAVFAALFARLLVFYGPSHFDVVALALGLVG